MNATTSPRPASLQRAEATEGDLDDRIRHAELRLVHREENLRRRVGALGARARSALQPRRLLVPVAGAALAIGALAMLWRWRGAPSRAAAAAAPSNDAGVPRSAGPWMALLGLVVPLLPPHWRSRLNPATVSTVMALGGTLLARVRQPRPAAPLATAAPVALRELSGRWHELARLGPSRGGLPSAGVPTFSITLRGDGRLTLQTRWHGDPAHDPAPQLAEPHAGSGGAQWRVTDWPPAWHWLPFAWHELWVLHANPARGELLLGSPARDTLHLLARSTRLMPERHDHLLALARERGYAVERLRFPDLA